MNLLFYPFLLGISLVLAGLSGPAFADKKPADFDEFWSGLGVLPTQEIALGPDEAFFRHGAHSWTYTHPSFESRLPFDLQNSMLESIFRRDDVLVISGHGSLPETGQFMVSNPPSPESRARGITADYAARILSRHLQWNRYRVILLFSCYGDYEHALKPGQSTFAKQLSAATGLPVVAPIGEVKMALRLRSVDEVLDPGAMAEYGGPLPPDWEKSGLILGEAKFHVVEVPSTVPAWRASYPAAGISHAQQEAVNDVALTLNHLHQDREMGGLKWFRGKLHPDFDTYTKRYLAKSVGCPSRVLSFSESAH